MKQLSSNDPSSTFSHVGEVPGMVETADGLQLEVSREEFVRLEGHHWHTHWEKGQQTVWICLDETLGGMAGKRNERGWEKGRAL